MATSYATIEDLKIEIQAVRDELKADVKDVRDELHVVRDELKADLGNVKADVRAVWVIAERIESKVSTIIEGLGSTREGLEREMNAREERLSVRIVTLEEVARHHSDDIHSLRIEIAELRLRFDRRDIEIDELEKRVSAVEMRLGIQS